VDDFFIRLTELSDWRQLRWSVELTSWLVVTAAAVGELARARRLRSTERSGPDASLPDRFAFLGEET
jgi:hypothetical protein